MLHTFQKAYGLKAGNASAVVQDTMSESLLTFDFNMLFKWILEKSSKQAYEQEFDLDASLGLSFIGDLDKNVTYGHVLLFGEDTPCHALLKGHGQSRPNR